MHGNTIVKKASSIWMKLRTSTYFKLYVESDAAAIYEIQKLILSSHFFLRFMEKVSFNDSL